MAKRPYNEITHAHMKMRKLQNERRSRGSLAEEAAWSVIRNSGYKFSRQACWGFRIFDFWCHKLGLAIEIDGKEHDATKDAASDSDHWNTSRIVVRRVKNFDMAALSEVLENLSTIGDWNRRRAEAGMKLIGV